MSKVTIQNKPKVILFDHDGTLIDSESTHFELWKQVLIEYGVTLDFEFYKSKMAGIPTEQNALDLITSFNLTVSVSALAEQKHLKLTQYLSEHAFAAVPDAVDVVQQAFKAGYLLAVVTGGTRASVAKTLTTYKLTDCFSAIVTVEDVKHSKPAPDCYQLAMQQLGVTADQCVAVEDTEAGMKAAIAADIPCAVIPTELTKQALFNGAYGRFTSLSEWYQSL